jgi:hypothetical protein
MRSFQHDGRLDVQRPIGFWNQTALKSILLSVVFVQRDPGQCSEWTSDVVDGDSKAAKDDHPSYETVALGGNWLYWDVYFPVANTLQVNTMSSNDAATNKIVDVNLPKPTNVEGTTDNDPAQQVSSRQGSAAVVGGITGAIVGGSVGGAPGALLGGVVGAIIGNGSTAPK